MDVDSHLCRSLFNRQGTGGVSDLTATVDENREWTRLSGEIVVPETMISDSLEKLTLDPKQD